ncbi:MAG TPA: aspartate aminotransferase family protein [Phycisphaerae bacterium]|nr:aspartate aminotransferase family protein [Phycisphaerae bacterium]
MPDMYSDFQGWLHQHEGRQYELHQQHVNAAFVKMLKTIGFDKNYVRGQGPYLWDADGNKYLDLLTGWGVFALGRNHPKIKAVLEQVLAQDLPNLVRMECSILSGLVAEKLTQHTSPGLSRVFFTNSGTETVEGALKFARCFTGRQKIVYCDHAFHGLTAGSLAVNGADFFRERFGELTPGTVKIPFNDLAALEQALAANDVAGFIVEPVQGKTCEVVAPGYLLEAQRLCKAAGTVLILDEVQCGLGRTGKWFCYHHFEGVEPDILCVAKALSGGYVPVGAVVARPEIMNCVFSSMERCVVHSNTYGQNDMAMAAALASLHVIEDEKLVENAAAMGEYVMSRLKAIGEKCPFVSDVRGQGLMFAIDFARPKSGFLLQQKWDALHKMNFAVFGQTVIVPLLQKHRILTQVAGYHTEVIKFLPPMTVTREDMDWFLSAMEDVLENTASTGSTLKTMFRLGVGAVRA